MLISWRLYNIIQILIFFIFYLQRGIVEECIASFNNSLDRKSAILINTDFYKFLEKYDLVKVRNISSHWLNYIFFIILINFVRNLFKQYILPSEIKKNIPATYWFNIYSIFDNADKFLSSGFEYIDDLKNGDNE